MCEMKKTWLFVSNKQFVIMLNEMEKRSLKEFVQLWLLFSFDKVNDSLNSKRSQRTWDVSITHLEINMHCSTLSECGDK